MSYSSLPGLAVRAKTPGSPLRKYILQIYRQQFYAARMPKLPLRTSQSRYPLLGMLQGGPGSGYDLRQRIDRSIGYFWHEGWGQIYPALRQMEDEKLVKCRVETSDRRRPDRRVYAITRKGSQALRKWLQEPPRREVPRNEMLLKLFFAHEMPAAQRLQLVIGQRESHQAALRTYDAIASALPAGYADHPSLPFWLMTVSCGVHCAKAEIAWCDETLKVLRAMTEVDQQEIA